MNLGPARPGGHPVLVSLSALPGVELLLHLLLVEIIDKLTIDYDLGAFHDSYKERIEAMIESKMKGEAVQVKEKGPKKPVAKSMMEMLRETAESLK